MMNQPGPFRRIVVIGNSGSGKSTLAGQLAAMMGVPHIEMDALHWEPGWVEAPLERFRERIMQVAAGERWVMDGSYGKVRDITWGAADTIVWLDYALPVTLWRLLWRTLKRTLGRTVLWNGNRERIRDQFFSRNSLFLWVVSTHARRRREYPALLARPEYAHLRLVRLRSPRETARWLSYLSGG
jgi:adenylate kinase family enzyme